MGKPYWRKGFTQEARWLDYDFAFHQLMVEEIHAQAWEGNLNSCRSIEKSGFVLLESTGKIFPKMGQGHKECHCVLKKQT
ncbi:GNAT family N-acetyltransferase [Peribacillus kribbensis]|uniref:GNAT family N-acetyltransferase n=1 Tax=Peribacillus kribbensis TaxID=356658 RepID=UPI000406813B|nr:GNAT family N-acetyltransferase [Peribacillus kribbensis]